MQRSIGKIPLTNLYVKRCFDEYQHSKALYKARWIRNSTLPSCIDSNILAMK